MSNDISKYDNTNTMLGFPSEFVTDAVKASKQYGLDYFRGMWWQNNGWSAFNERYQRMFTLRRWAEGTQDIDDLKQIMSTGGDTSFLNIDLKPISVIPKFLDSMVGLLLNQPFKIQCNAIDKISVSKKDDEKARLETEIILKKFSDELKQRTGVALMNDERANKMLKTKEEIDLYMDLIFKLAEELAMELGLEYVFYNNDFEEIKKQLLYDLFTLKIAGTYCWYDRNKKICIERIKPEWMITSYTDRDDFKNITNFAFIRFERIQDIRKAAGNQFTDQEYLAIAKCASDKYGNPRWNSRFTYYPNSNMYNLWNNFQTPVMYGEFVSDTYKEFETFVNKEGAKRITPALKKKPDADQYSFDIANKYDGKWIVDTDYIYDYGKSSNMPRERMNGVYSLDVPFGATIYMPNNYGMDNKSHVERMIHSAQQMQLAESKIQQMQAAARPKGYVINIAGMQPVDLGLGKGPATPLQIQSLFDQKGILYTNLVGEDGNPLPIPIIPMDSGLDLPGIQAQIMIYNLHLEMIRDLTGMNQSVDASTPSTEALVGIQKMAANATLNTLRPIKSAYINIIERTAKYASLMIQDCCRYGDGIEGFVPAIGDRASQIIKLGAEISLPDLGIKIEALPTDEEKAIIFAGIDESVAKGFIKPSDGLFAKTMGNLKQMRLYLKYCEEKLRKDKMEEAQANAEASAQANAQAGQAVEQEKQNTVQVDGQQKAQLLSIEAEIKQKERDDLFNKEMQKLAVVHNYTMQEIAESNAGKDKSNQTSDMIK